MVLIENLNSGKATGAKSASLSQSQRAEAKAIRFSPGRAPGPESQVTWHSWIQRSSFVGLPANEALREEFLTYVDFAVKTKVLTVHC